MPCEVPDDIFVVRDTGNVHKAGPPTLGTKREWSLSLKPIVRKTFECWVFLLRQKSVPAGAYQFLRLDKMPSWATHFIFCSQGLPWFSNNASIFATCDSPGSHLQLGNLCIQVLVPALHLQTAGSGQGDSFRSPHCTMDTSLPHALPSPSIATRIK